MGGEGRGRGRGRGGGGGGMGVWGVRLLFTIMVIVHNIISQTESQ